MFSIIQFMSMQLDKLVAKLASNLGLLRICIFTKGTKIGKGGPVLAAKVGPTGPILAADRFFRYRTNSHRASMLSFI